MQRSRSNSNITSSNLILCFPIPRDQSRDKITRQKVSSLWRHAKLRVTAIKRDRKFCKSIAAFPSRRSFAANVPLVYWLWKEGNNAYVVEHLSIVSANKQRSVLTKQDHRIGRFANKQQETIVWLARVAGSSRRPDDDVESEIFIAHFIDLVA